jgi:hypothetical protein
MQLRAWLNHPKRDFDIGVKLYAQHIGGSTEVFKYKNSVTQKKLYAALKEYDDSKIAKNLSSLKKDIQTTAKQEPNKPKLPPEIVRLHDLKLETFKKMAALHQHLCTIKGNSQKSMDSRLKLQQEIMRLDELNAECWDKIIYWEEHGKLPVEKDGFAIGDKTIRELAQLEKAIPTYITKLNKELDGLGDDDKKRISITKRIADWHMQYRSIKDSIDELPTLKRIKEALSGTN